MVAWFQCTSSLQDQGVRTHPVPKTLYAVPHHVCQWSLNSCTSTASTPPSARLLPPPFESTASWLQRPSELHGKTVLAAEVAGDVGAAASTRNAGVPGGQFEGNMGRQHGQAQTCLVNSGLNPSGRPRQAGRHRKQLPCSLERGRDTLGSRDGAGAAGRRASIAPVARCLVRLICERFKPGRRKQVVETGSKSRSHLNRS